MNNRIRKTNKAMVWIAELIEDNEIQTFIPNLSKACCEC